MNLSFMNHNNNICVFLICSAKSNYESFRNDCKLEKYNERFRI